MQCVRLVHRSVFRATTGFGKLDKEWKVCVLRDNVSDATPCPVDCWPGSCPYLNNSKDADAVSSGHKTALLKKVYLLLSALLKNSVNKTKL